MQQKEQKMSQPYEGDSLEELVPLYHDANLQAKHFKESAAKVGEQIKNICLSGDIKKKEIGGYKLSIVVQHRSSFDEEVLLECTRKLPERVQAKLIKVKQYVDPQELEKALFMGVIKPEDVAPAQIDKEVVTLRVAKK